MDTWVLTAFMAVVLGSPALGQLNSVPSFYASFRRGWGDKENGN